MDLDDLKVNIVAKLDELELLDILGLTVVDLVDILEENISEQAEELARAIK